MQQVRGRAVSTRPRRAEIAADTGVTSPSPLYGLCEGPVRKSPIQRSLRRRQPPKSTYRAGERYAVHPRRRVGRPPKVGCRTPWPACRSRQRQWGAGARACSAIGQIDDEWPQGSGVSFSCSWSSRSPSMLESSSGFGPQNDRLGVVKGDKKCSRTRTPKKQPRPQKPKGGGFSPLLAL